MEKCMYIHIRVHIRNTRTTVAAAPALFQIDFNTLVVAGEQRAFFLLVNSLAKNSYPAYFFVREGHHF